MFLLDTNVVSELRRDRPHRAVLDWLAAEQDSGLFVCAATIGEIQTGIELTRRQDPTRASELEAWLEGHVLAEFTVIDMDAAAFREWARLMIGQSDTLSLDAMIAATANVHGLQVVTRNVRDFEQLEIPVLNPFEHGE